MNPRERVQAAICHRPADRTPRGDLAIEGDLLRRIVGEVDAARMTANACLLAACRRLGSDLANIHQFPMQPVGETDSGALIYRSVLGDEHVMVGGSCQLHRPALVDIAEAASYEPPDPATCLTDALDWFVARSDLFVFAQIMGPVSSLDWMLGTEDFLVYCMTDTHLTRLLMEKVVSYETARARTFLDHGADAIMMTDDIAYNGGLFLPPRIMDELAWPLYQTMVCEIKAHRDVPVFLHTDGDIRTALPNIAACGFDGLHSLQPSAGVDIAEVKREYGDRLCLMGNLDLDHLMPFAPPAEVARQARWLCESIGRDGGYILATCNILTGAIPVENVLAMYGAADPQCEQPINEDAE